MGKLRFFNLDLHISVIQDVKNILGHLYGPVIDITNWSISGHTWVFKQSPTSVDVINAQTWFNITPAMVAEFQARYDSFLAGFDGFIVTHTPVFCMLYEKYGKPIIMVNSCRYEQPFSRSGAIKSWIWLNQGLARMASKGQLVAISNNKADAEYLRLGTGVISRVIPSLCDYTCASYNPSKSVFVCYGERGLFPPSPLLVERPRDGYTWSELYSYRGIVHVPYEISTMSLFEQYSAGVPLWLPSRRFYSECIRDGCMKLISVYGRAYPAPLKETCAADFWLDRADFYDSENFRYVRFYDSPADLLAQLASFSETDAERRTRMSWISARRLAIYNAWLSVFSQTPALADVHRGPEEKN